MKVEECHSTINLCLVKKKGQRRGKIEIVNPLGPPKTIIPQGDGLVKND